MYTNLFMDKNSMHMPVDNGTQVTVFLLDTSIETNHREIKGKVMMTDFNSVPEEEGVQVHRQVRDRRSLSSYSC